MAPRARPLAWPRARPRPCTSASRSSPRRSDPHLPVAAQAGRAPCLCASCPCRRADPLAADMRPALPRARDVPPPPASVPELLPELVHAHAPVRCCPTPASPHALPRQRAWATPALPCPSSLGAPPRFHTPISHLPPAPLPHTYRPVHRPAGPAIVTAPPYVWAAVALTRGRMRTLQSGGHCTYALLVIEQHKLSARGAHQHRSWGSGQPSMPTRAGRCMMRAMPAARLACVARYLHHTGGATAEQQNAGARNEACVESGLCLGSSGRRPLCRGC